MVDRRLGRGLDFFLSDAAGGPSASDEGDVIRVEVSQLVPNPHQPRTEFAVAELEELAQSIRTSGLLQPILVRRAGSRFQIIAGERRWRAAKLAGLERIPALIRDVTDEQSAVFGLVENVHRSDLNALEKAKAFRRIQELTKGTQEEVARQVGLERSTVANFLRLLDSPGAIQAMVANGHLSMGHARALLGLENEAEQRQVADEIVRRRLSVRQVEELVRSIQVPPPAEGVAQGKDRAPKRAAWLKELEDTLGESLGAKVSVRHGRKRCKITIECGGGDDFERVYEALKSLGAGGSA